MHADDVRSEQPIRYGAYLAIGSPPGASLRAAGAAVGALAERLGLRNEFQSVDGDPRDAIAFLRRADAVARGIADEALSSANGLVHVASPTADVVAEACAELRRLLPPEVGVRVLRGVVRPPIYTGNLMHNFAYARRVLQQPGASMPNGFLVPLSKLPAWWKKSWMERHTYFLPRYDGDGKMLSEGHALAAEAGISCVMRRSYASPQQPSPAEGYDFLTYFECADADVPTFHAVCAALRDTRRNPEWAFVREGPTWHGRRVATWSEMFA
jgi:hypothetical protein